MKIKIIREELGETVEKSDLDRTHRTDAFKEGKSKCRPIIVKFSSCNVGDKVFKNKKKLKGKGYSITESLTAMRMKKLTEARNSFGFTNVWTQDGKILCKEDNRIKVFLTNCVQRSHLKVFLKNSVFTYKGRKLTTLAESLILPVGKFVSPRFC